LSKLTDLRSNDGRDNSSYRSSRKIGERKKSKMRNIGLGRNMQNEKDVMKMFKNYRIKCPDNDTNYDDDSSSVNRVHQKYCREVQAENKEMNTRMTGKENKLSEKYPTSVSLSLYPPEIRVPKFCSSSKSDGRRSTSLCKKMMNRAKKLAVPTLSEKEDFGSTFQTTRSRKTQGTASRLFNPLP
jgi:hypothetical protein